MSLKFNKDQHNLISEALRNYIKHLELIEYNDLKYIEELRSFLGKLLRETDWSYLLWTSPKKGIAGKIKIIRSSTIEYPRGSKWLLFHNGNMKLSSFFRSRKMNLINSLIALEVKSESLFSLSLSSKDFIEIEADSSSGSALKELNKLLADESFKHRTIPYLIIIDSIQFFLENKRPLDPQISSKLIATRDILSAEYYTINPKYIKVNLTQNIGNNDSGKRKLEIGQDSLFFLEEILYEYCDLLEKSASADPDLEKLVKAKKLSEIFRAANQ